MFDICLVILIGVPGSGKTTLSQALVTCLENNKTLDKCVVIPVCYDSLILLTLENQLWKEARKSVLHNVQQLVNYLKNLELGSSTALYQWKPVVEKILNTSDEEKKTKVVIIIDDNMYYRSMRYEYYQLARVNELGFCQVYIDCALDDALKRNECRDTAVPAAVIRKMFNLIEPPDEKINSWEKTSMCVSSCTLSEPDVLANLAEFISRTLQDPLIPKQDLSKLREESQIISNTTALHQTDLALRRLVAEEITKAKQLGKTSHELSVKAASLGEIRKKLLDNIRLGVHVIPSDIVAAIEHHEPNATHKLHSFLSKSFSVLINEESS